MMKAKIFNIQKFSLHDGKGIRTSVFFAGCRLRCKWCCNPECFIENEHIEYDLAFLLDELLKDKVFYDKSDGGVTLSGGDIWMQLDFIIELVKLLKINKVSVAIESSAYIDAAIFKNFIEQVDFVFVDLKHYDKQKHIDETGVSNEPILHNIATLVQSGIDYCVRIPVIPKYNDSLADAEYFAKLFKKLKVKNIELLPFHQFGEQKYEKLGLDYKYKNIQQLHKEDLKDYYKILGVE